MERHRGFFYWQPWTVMLAAYGNSHAKKGAPKIVAEKLNPYLKRKKKDNEVIHDKKLFMEALKTVVGGIK